MAEERRGEDAGDLLEVLDDGISQLPVEVAAGHRPAEDPDLVRRPVVARSDSGGTSVGFVGSCRDRNIRS